MPRPYLSVIIPAFNEAQRLPLTLIDVDRHLAAQDFECEIIVALSPSSDNTAEILKRFQSIIKHLKVITLIENQGKGFAIRQGMQAAKGAYRLMMDADNSTSVIEFAKMLPYLHPKEGTAYDVVIGSRYIPGGHIDPPEPIGRKIAGRIGRLFTRSFIVKKVIDPSCGFKVFSAHAADVIFPMCVTNKWAIEAEVLALAQRMGFSIKEVPVYWSYDLGGHTRSTFELLHEHIALWWRLVTNRYQKASKL